MSSLNRVSYFATLVLGTTLLVSSFASAAETELSVIYNRAVTNPKGAEVRNVYSKTVVENITVNNVSYSGGPGGVIAAPTAEEQAAVRASHHPPTAAQVSHRASAGSRHELRPR